MQLVLYPLVAGFAYSECHGVNSDSSQLSHDNKQVSGNDIYFRFIGCLCTDEPV